MSSTPITAATLRVIDSSAAPPRRFEVLVSAVAKDFGHALPMERQIGEHGTAISSQNRVSGE